MPITNWFQLLSCEYLLAFAFFYHLLPLVKDISIDSVMGICSISEKEEKSKLRRYGKAMITKIYLQSQGSEEFF